LLPIPSVGQSVCLYDWHSVHGSRSACTDPEVKRLKVKVTQLQNVLPAWVCMSLGLFFTSIYYVSRTGIKKPVHRQQHPFSSQSLWGPVNDFLCWRKEGYLTTKNFRQTLLGTDGATCWPNFTSKMVIRSSVHMGATKWNSYACVL